MPFGPPPKTLTSLLTLDRALSTAGSVVGGFGGSCTTAKLVIEPVVRISEESIKASTKESFALLKESMGRQFGSIGRHLDHQLALTILLSAVTILLNALIIGLIISRRRDQASE
jgi:hypothetical protein